MELTPAASSAWWHLSRGYEREFGVPPCVTDSYRSLAAQEALRSAKPGLAARPGTSNHGWGLALDLCGGIESFSTAEHQWLAWRAGRWGWTNPPWARASGTKPEPWHWEYADPTTPERTPGT